MSLIASFFVLPEQELAEINKWSKPSLVEREKGWLFLKTKTTEVIDKFPDYLERAANLKLESKTSGNALLYLHMFLEENELDFLSYCEKEQSEQLQENRGQTAAIFTHEGAGLALSKLNSVQFSNQDLEAFLLEEGCETAEVSNGLSAVQASHVELVKWFETVQPGQIGTLFLS